MKFYKLEYIRAISCILVLCGHIKIFSHYFEAPSFAFLQLFCSWGKEAVIAFFMLSGIVINATSSKTQTWKIYIKKRAIRIFPIYYFSLLISIVVGIAICSNTYSILDLLGNVFFLASEAGYIVYPINTNLPLWSLSCEVLFYLIFSIGLLLDKKYWINAWMLMSVLSIAVLFVRGYFDNPIFNHFMYILNYSFLWLLGYYIYEFKDKVTISLPFALFCVSMIPMATRVHDLPVNLDFIRYLLAGLLLMPLFKYSIQIANFKTSSTKIIFLMIIIYACYIPFFLKHSNSLFISKLIYLILPILSLLIFNGFIRNGLKKIFSIFHNYLIYFGKISYALYVIHLPIIYIVIYFIPNNIYLGSLLILFVSTSMSHILDIKIQPLINLLFNKDGSRYHSSN